MQPFSRESAGIQDVDRRIKIVIESLEKSEFSIAKKIKIADDLLEQINNPINTNDWAVYKCIKEETMLIQMIVTHTTNLNSSNKLVHSY